MKHLLAVCISLCLIAALTPAVSALIPIPPTWAWMNNSYYNTFPYSTHNVTNTGIHVAAPTEAEMDSFCAARGKGASDTTVFYTTSDGYVSIGSSSFIGWDAGGLTIDTAEPYNHKYGLIGSHCTGGDDPFGDPWLVKISVRTDLSEFGALTADFNATPLSGQAPLYVAFQDNSTGTFGTTSYNWSVSPNTGVIGDTSTSAYPTMAFAQNGNYTITHCISDTTGSDCETKTDHIWVYNGTATATTTFWAVDPLGHRVYDSAISLQDVENTSWTNTSSPSGGVATITSLIGHTINGYATAAGYNDGETLGITADGVTGGIILMTPTNITNVSAGYVTLYVYVKEAVGNAPVSGAYVNIAYASGGSTVNDGGTTSTDGIASFTVPNKTLIYVYGEKAGYNQVSTTKDSGTGSGGSASVSTIIYLSRITVTTIPTATTLPGGGTPTTTVTADPRTSEEKQTDIANIILDYGEELVLFFIALTFIGGIQLIGKR